MTSLVPPTPATGLFLALVASCSAPPPVDPAGKPEVVSWQRAVELVNSNLVATVYQTHALSVQLNLKDGTKVQTTEPAIDEIIRVIGRCGQKCSDVMIATE